MSRKGVKRITALLLACMTALIMISIGATTALADWGDDGKDWSFYKVSSAAAARLNEAVAPKEDGWKPWIVDWVDGDETRRDRLQYVTSDDKLPLVAADIAGYAGAWVGYCDSADSMGKIVGWIFSNLSNSSALYTVDTLRNVDTYNKTEGREQTHALYAYCKYGYMLTACGLDSTESGVSAGMGKLIRVAGGSVMLLLLVMSLSVPTLFRFVLGLLQAINPFYWFPKSVSGVTPIGANAVVFAGLRSYIGIWYDTLTSFSWTIVVPVCIAAFIIGLTLFKKTYNIRSGWRKLLTRMLLIIVAIPVCGMCYTSALETMKQSIDGGTGSATEVIASTFLDFESWAKDGLALPNDTMLNSITFSVHKDTGVDPSVTGRLRDICLAINAKSNSDLRLASHKMDGSFASSGLSDYEAVDSEGESAETKIYNKFGATADLLARYISGESYTAGDYETDVKGALRNEALAEIGSDTESEAAKAISRMFDASNDADDYKNDEYDDRFTWETWDNSGVPNIFTNVYHAGKTSAFTTRDLLGACVNVKGDVLFKGSDSTIVGSGSVLKGGGLSVMSMYNYLTSKFDDSSVTVYSSKNSPNIFSVESHKSVNLIGTGFVSFLYWLNAAVLLVALAIIGWFYAFSLLFKNLKRSFKLLTSVPMMLLGSVQAGSRFIGGTAIMIIEIVGTIFCYELVTKLLLAIVQAVEAPFQTFAAGVVNTSTIGAPGGLLLGGAVLPMLGLIVSIIVVIGFVVLALRVRKTFVKAVDESLTKTLDRWITGEGKPQQEQKKPGLVQRAVGSVGSGLGMAAGSRMMDGAVKAMGTNSVKGVESAKSEGDKKADSGGKSDGGDGKDTSQSVGKQGSGPQAAGQGSTPSDKGSGIIDQHGGGVNVSSSQAAGIAEGGGSGGAGSVAGTFTNAAFADNNKAQEENARGESLLGNSELRRSSGQASTPIGIDAATSPSKSESEQKAERRDVKAEGMEASMSGKTNMLDEEQAEEAAAKEKKEAGKRQAKAVVQTAVGVGEVAGAAATGDVSLAKDGIKNTKNGLGGVKDAQAQKDQADVNASKQAIENAEVRRAQAQNERGGEFVEGGGTRGGGAGRDRDGSGDGSTVVNSNADVKSGDTHVDVKQHVESSQTQNIAAGRRASQDGQRQREQAYAQGQQQGRRQASQEAGHFQQSQNIQRQSHTTKTVESVTSGNTPDVPLVTEAAEEEKPKIKRVLGNDRARYQDD